MKYNAAWDAPAHYSRSNSLALYRIFLRWRKRSAEACPSELLFRARRLWNVLRTIPCWATSPHLAEIRFVVHLRWQHWKLWKKKIYWPVSKQKAKCLKRYYDILP